MGNTSSSTSSLALEVELRELRTRDYSHAVFQTEATCKNSRGFMCLFGVDSNTVAAFHLGSKAYNG